MSELDQLKGKQQFGMATLPGGRVANARFFLDGRETVIQIADESNGIGISRIPTISVEMIDGTKLTFLKNIRTKSTRHHGGGGSLITYMPHFVLIGRSEVDPDSRIREIVFSTGDADKIFYDFDAFSVDLSADRKRIGEIIKDQTALVGRPVEVGDNPIIAYFTGKFSIFSVEADDLTVFARHRPSYGMGGPNGVAIHNKIMLGIDLRAPKPLDDAITHLIKMLRFLQIIAGRKQAISDLQVRLEAATEHDWHDLLWCLAFSQDGSPEDSPHPGDVLVNGGSDPIAFGEVLSGWLQTDECNIDARVRFSQTFEQGRAYGADRIVSSANVFDLLPSTYFTPRPPLTKPELDAKAKAIEVFRDLPRSDVRDRALGDLGRLGEHNLKSRVLERATKIIKIAGRRLDGLDLILRDAIDARNHFVHGTKVGARRAKLFRQEASFYIGALEMTFAMAEMLECGWDMRKWLQGHHGYGHPFAEFLINFSPRLSQYRKRRTEG